jgi:hypothetical protein
VLVAPFGTATLDGVTVRESTAVASAGGMGGAIANGGVLTVVDSVFSGNSADFGGAIRNWGSMTVAGSTFTGNNAGVGAALQHIGGIRVTSSTFVANTAMQRSVVANDGGDLELVHTTITRNNFGAGPVVGTTGSSADTSMVNSIVTGNGPTPDVGHIPAGSTLTSGGANLVGTAATSSQGSLTGAGDQLAVTETQAFGAASPAQGADGTIPTVPGALAIDRAPCPTGVLTDQRGVARPQHAACDSGAYEYDGALPEPPQHAART